MIVLFPFLMDIVSLFLLRVLLWIRGLLPLILQRCIDRLLIRHLIHIFNPTRVLLMRKMLEFPIFLMFPKRWRRKEGRMLDASYFSFSFFLYKSFLFECFEKLFGIVIIYHILFLWNLWMFLCFALEDTMMYLAQGLVFYILCWFSI